MHYRPDATGRNYLYDKHGNRVYKKGTTRPGTADTSRPRTVKLEDWFKLDKDARKDLSEYLKEKGLETGRGSEHTQGNADGTPNNGRRRYASLQYRSLHGQCPRPNPRQHQRNK